MPEQVEKHGEVQVVVGTPRSIVSAGEDCPRCQQVVLEHRFLWPKADANLTLSLRVEACYCGIRLADAGTQRMDETPELWGSVAMDSEQDAGDETGMDI